MIDGRFIGTRTGMGLTNLFAAPQTTQPDWKQLRTGELRRWCRERLTHPHPDLGRAGPVCPFTGPAISRQGLWADFIAGSDIGDSRLIEVIDDIFDLFADLPPREEPDCRFKAVMVAFPDLVDYPLVDTVQLAQKTRFVEHGLMLGQFYPGCTKSGLRNPDFPALDAPMPMLAVRHMVPSDLPFLETRAEWLDAYHRQFATT